MNTRPQFPMMQAQQMPQGNSMLAPSTMPPMPNTGAPMSPPMAMPMPIQIPSESQIRAYMIQKYMAMPTYDQTTANSPPDVSVRGGILSKIMNPNQGGY